MTRVVRKRKGKVVAICNESINFSKYRFLWRMLNSGKSYTVCTVNYTEPETIFGSYFKVFNLYIKKGTLLIKTIDQLGDDEPYIEFNLEGY